MTDNPAPVQALGEIAIRCRDFQAMRAFYREIVGLEEMKYFEQSRIAFFRIAPGYGGHTTILALFAADAVQRDVHEDGATEVQTGAGSSFHHMALTVDYDRQDALVAWLTEKGLAPSVQEFDWIGWRGVFIKDPDGNTVEFVAGGHRPG